LWIRTREILKPVRARRSDSTPLSTVALLRAGFHGALLSERRRARARQRELAALLKLAVAAIREDVHRVGGADIPRKRQIGSVSRPSGRVVWRRPCNTPRPLWRSEANPAFAPGIPGTYVRRLGQPIREVEEKAARSGARAALATSIALVEVPAKLLKPKAAARSTTATSRQSTRRLYGACRCRNSDSSGQRSGRAGGPLLPRSR